MFKNHDNEINNSSCLENLLSSKHINSILYSDPFVKAGFISTLVREAKTDVLYLDLDLLYSGYVISGTFPESKTLKLYRPTIQTLDEMLTEILAKASASQVLVIIDSINGLFNVLHGKKDVGRVVTTIIMLLASITHLTDSSIVVASMVRYKKEEGWVLSPTGKRVIETKNSKKILLEHNEEGIVVNLLDDSRKMLIPANLIQL